MRHEKSRSKENRRNEFPFRGDRAVHSTSNNWGNITVFNYVLYQKRKFLKGNLKVDRVYLHGAGCNFSLPRGLKLQAGSTGEEPDNQKVCLSFYF